MERRWTDEDLLEPMREALGARLRELRKKSGMVLTDASEASGLSPNFIGEVELGKKLPSLPSLVALCDIYGVLAADALRGVVPFDAYSAPFQQRRGRPRTAAAGAR